jgi:hypothetical protein
MVRGKKVCVGVGVFGLFVQSTTRVWIIRAFPFFRTEKLCICGSFFMRLRFEG